MTRRGHLGPWGVSPRNRTTRRPAVRRVLTWTLLALAFWGVAVLDDGFLPWIAAFAAASVAVAVAFAGRRRV